MSPKVSQKLQRLVAILSERATWATELAQVTRMQQWVLEAEQILSGQGAQPGEVESRRDRGETVGCMATDTRRPAHRWHALAVGADLSERVRAGAL